MRDVRRREFIMLLGGAAAAWPLAARAQQGEPMRRIGVLTYWGPNNRVALAGIAAFKKALQQSGWSEGVNTRIDMRWCENSVERARTYAAELVALTPDVILASNTPSVVALQSITRTLPIVFVSVSDPEGAGVVASLARPGGNATGFMNSEYSLSTKWLELLKQIVPGLVRALVVRDARNPAGIGQFSAIQASAQPLGVEVRAVNIHDTGEIERALSDFSRLPNGGLIVTPTAGQSIHRDLIITLAARLKLPAVYADPEVVTAGGLISYGPDRVDQFRRAADYVDRILKGEKASDLPVQAPTKYELVINQKAAKALALEIPPTLLALADGVIE
jgi:putative tryptophan/tyrosine transport system substrate-binding protein